MKPDETIGRSKPSAGDPAGDHEWVDRARGGDAGAFRMLVERYRTRVYGLCLRIVRSPADAEEVAQDAFVRAWLALPRFRGESSFSTWIYRIAARRAFDRAAARPGSRRRASRRRPNRRPPAAGGRGSSSAWSRSCRRRSARR